MSGTRFAVLAALVMLLSVAGAFSAHAARTLRQGGYIVGMFPMGDWSKVAGAGLGLDGTNIVHPDDTKPLGIRSSLGIGYNFSRKADVPQSNTPGSTLTLDTSNFNLWFGIGPEFSKSEGPIVPFVFGTIGLDVNWTNSSLDGTVTGTPYSANVGASNTVFAWSAGGGLRKQMKNAPGGRVELSAEYRSGMNHSYVMPDEVTSTGSSVSWDRKDHNADQILVRLGSVF